MFKAISNRRSTPPQGEMESEAVSARSALTLRTGFLWKKGGGKKSTAWKQRWFILTKTRTLYYSKSPKDPPRGQISLTTYAIEPFTTSRSPYSFKLTPTSKETTRVYFLCSASEEDLKGWKDMIQKCVEGSIFNVNKSTIRIEERLKTNSYEIPESEIQWNESKILGKGASGVVRKALWLETTEVAVKSLNNLPEFVDPSDLNKFYKEIDLLSGLRHPNIVTMYGYCKKSSYVCLVTEFVSGGNLEDIINDNKVTYNVIDFAMSICKGMIYLHSKNILHRDLKPGNILVESVAEAKLKVCDFGLSKALRPAANMTSTLTTINNQPSFGTPAYAAPELPEPDHTSKVDTYSFGIILWELCTREYAWNNIPQPWVITEKVYKGERPVIPDTCQLKSLIKKCWSNNPHERPTFKEIFKELAIIKNGGVNVDVSEEIGDNSESTTSSASSYQLESSVDRLSISNDQK